MDGLIVIDKPKEVTSHDVVRKVKKILNVKKVGHTGTLDPNATGVLPILVGNGTKLSKYLINHDKIYEVVLKLGEKTDTADSEGKIIETRKVEKEQLKEENIKKVLESFLGKQSQVPPIYSAIKVNGKKLYEYARKGEEVEVKPREITIYGITFIKLDEEELSFEVACSKGTYIRSLCEDIAKRMKTVGYMKELRRKKVGKFDLDFAITIEELEENKENEEFIQDHFYSIERLYKNNPEIKLNKKKMQLFLNGVKLSFDKEDGVYRIYDEAGVFCGLGLVEEKLLKRDIIVEE